MHPFILGGCHYRDTAISVSIYVKVPRRDISISTDGASNVAGNQRYPAMSKRAANEFLVSAHSAFEHSRTRELLVGVNLIHVQDRLRGIRPGLLRLRCPNVAQTARPTA